MKVSNIFARHLALGWQPFVLTIFKARFDGWYFTSYIYSLFYMLTWTNHWHTGGDRGITRKYRNHEAPHSIWKVLVTVVFCSNRVCIAISACNVIARMRPQGNFNFNQRHREKELPPLRPNTYVWIGNNKDDIVESRSEQFLSCSHA